MQYITSGRQQSRHNSGDQNRCLLEALDPKRVLLNISCVTGCNDIKYYFLNISPVDNN